VVEVAVAIRSVYEEWVDRSRVLSRRLESELGEGFEVVYAHGATRRSERIKDANT
jgi:hypothetical protein